MKDSDNEPIEVDNEEGEVEEVEVQGSDREPIDDSEQEAQVLPRRSPRIAAMMADARPPRRSVRLDYKPGVCCNGMC